MTAGDRERPALLSKRIIRNPRSSTNHSSLLGLTMALLSRLSNSNGEHVARQKSLTDGTIAYASPSDADASRSA